MNTLSEVVDMLGFLFRSDAEIVVDPAAGLTPESDATLAAAADALAGLDTFDHTAIEAALRRALVEGLGLKPKLAFGPVRAAITGRRISPPLFESIELLGRQSALARIKAARASLGVGRAVG
jgi:glutamyl-tRNA synthetase